MITLLVIVVWVACAAVSAGFTFAYFQSEFAMISALTYHEDLIFSLLLGMLGGPISAVMTFGLSGCAKHGWRLR